MSYQNKYFNALGITQLDRNISVFDNVVFIQDVGPYKRGDKYPSGYITVNIKANTICIEMNTEIEPLGPVCPLTYTAELI